MSRRAHTAVWATAWFAAAAALWWAAARIASEPTAAGDAAAPPTSRVRTILRPLLLPFLWNDLLRASRREPPEAVAARGRAVLELIPEWTAGHVFFAGQLAFAASLRAEDAEVAADRLQAALVWLETVIARQPRCAPEVLPAMASFVEIRCGQEPALAEELRRRTGKEPAELADRYLARAIAAAPPDRRAVRERRVFLQMGVVAGALRADDLPRALATIEWMRAQLTSLRDRDLAAAWDRALDLLHRFLRREQGVSLADLRAEPVLADVIGALRPH